MFGLTRKSDASRGRTGLSRSPEGISVAQVTRDKALIPRVSVCQFVEGGDHGEPEAMVALLDGIRLGSLPCNWALAGDDYQLLLVEAPEVEPGELRAAVRWRIRDLIEFHIDDAVIDVFDVPGQKTGARARMMYAVACRSPLVQKVVDALEDSELDLQVIDIAELAMRNVAALLEEDVSGVALLHLERDYGLITISRQTSLYLARKLDIGFAQLGEALAADGADVAFPGPALQGLLEQIVLEVQRSLDYYESHLSSSPATALYLDPPVGMPASLTEYFEQNLGVPVRALDLNRVLDCGGELEPERQSRCLLALGAALRLEQAAL